MTSRQRLQATLNHQAPDRVCVDFGSTAITGMHASAVSRLPSFATFGAVDNGIVWRTTTTATTTTALHSGGAAESQPGAAVPHEQQQKQPQQQRPA